MPRFVVHLKELECNKTSDWLNHTVKPIRSCCTLKVTISWREKKNVPEIGY